MEQFVLNIGKNSKLNVLFGYEDLKSGVISIITCDNGDGLNIVYEIYDGLKDVEYILDYVGIWNYDEYPLDMLYANWMGNDSNLNIKNGLSVDYGDFYLGWKKTRKRKLTINELNDILSKEYKSINSVIISNSKKIKK